MDQQTQYKPAFCRPAEGHKITNKMDSGDDPVSGKKSQAFFFLAAHKGGVLPGFILVSA